jgi:hypothetical protein
LASIMAAGSLPALRSIMLAADGDRPAARMHPAVDVRSGAQLLQRVGLGNPVADARAGCAFGSLRALSRICAQGWAAFWPTQRLHLARPPMRALWTLSPRRPMPMAA